MDVLYTKDGLPVFYPTFQQFSQGLEKCMKEIEPILRKSGICKVIPPSGWINLNYSTSLDHVRVRPMTQIINGTRGTYQLALLKAAKNMSVEEFKLRVEKKQASEPPIKDKDDIEAVERAFWRSLSTLKPSPEYGADLLGSLFEQQSACGWNLDALDTCLSQGLGRDLPGVTRAYLYFGMWRAMFAWHKEDMDLMSINYLHFGAPKTWYGIVSSEERRFEALAESFFGEEKRNCPQFLRHKTTVISPKKLKDSNISFVKGTQYAGEFMITHAAAYHSGFNHGFNCAEAVNFATHDWVPYGHRARLCKCWDDTVRINMEEFESNLQESKKSTKKVSNKAAQQLVLPSETTSSTIETNVSQHLASNQMKMNDAAPKRYNQIQRKKNYQNTNSRSTDSSASEPIEIHSAALFVDNVSNQVLTNRDTLYDDMTAHKMTNSLEEQSFSSLSSYDVGISSVSSSSSNSSCYTEGSNRTVNAKYRSKNRKQARARSSTTGKSTNPRHQLTSVKRYKLDHKHHVQYSNTIPLQT